MIKVFGRLLCVPENEKALGYVADNLVETRQFRVTDPSLFSFSFKLELENGSLKDIIDLPHTMEDGALILQWNITASCLQFAGPLFVQLRAFSDADMVWHSEIAEFTVNRSIKAEASLPPIVPSEFAEMEKRMTSLLTATETASLSASDAAEEASTYVDAVSALSAAASEDAARAAAAACDAAQILADTQKIKQSISMSEELAENAVISTNAACSQAYSYAESASESAAKIMETFGDMNAALDGILSLQASYIGGDSV